MGTSPDWQLTGLSLPASGQIRARGAISGSTGLIQQTAAFLTSTDADNDGLLDSWELTYWPATAGHGPHDDDDRDGYDSLLELAFGLNPSLPDTNGLPAFTSEGGYLTMTITKRPGAAYEVQVSTTSLPDSFSATGTTIHINTATTLKVSDSVPLATGPRRFMRAKVTAAP